MQPVVTLIFLLFCGHVAFSMKLLPTTTTNMAMKAKGDSEILIGNDTDDDDDEDLDSAASNTK